MAWGDDPGLSVWTLDTITGVLRRGRLFEIWWAHNRKSDVQMGAEEWGDAAICQIMPADSHQKMKEARNGFSSTAARGGMSLQTLWFQPNDSNFRFLVSRMKRNYISFVFRCHFVANCYDIQRKLIHVEIHLSEFLSAPMKKRISILEHRHIQYKEYLPSFLLETF